MTKRYTISVKGDSAMADASEDGQSPINPCVDPTILAASVEILDQGIALLEAIPDEFYTKRVPVAFNAAIGGHYRHCLDHFHSIAMGTDNGVINYDNRRRDPLIETDRFAALNETRRLRDLVTRLSNEELSHKTKVICKTSYADCGTQTANATVGRELMYAVAHAVHHYALIGIMANIQGITLPAGFGVAPSTIKHQQTLLAQRTTA